jgi:hypothetical protein
MVSKLRISIGTLMGVVLVAALGFAALRNASEACAGLVLMLTYGVLMIGVVGAVCRGSHERTWWLGFTLFGGGYLALAYASAFYPKPLPTITLAEFIGSGLGDKLAGRDWGHDGWISLSPTYRILHCLWALAMGLLGCMLAGLIVGPGVPAPKPVEETRSDRRLLSIRWKYPAVIGLAGFWIVAMIATVGRWPAPGLWAGTGFLLTCALLGLASLAAVFSRGRDRKVWLGAALFGFAYLTLTFGKSQLFIVAPHLPTEGMINRLLRPGGPPIHTSFPDFTSDASTAVKNRVIMKKLDQPIQMHFPDEVPFEDVLKYIRTATADDNFPGIPIYVDPVGLENSEKTLASTVRNLDFDAIPVKDGLELCLMQLDLGFSVRQGFVMISDGYSATIPVFEDPVQVVGHSLLALIAAGVGTATARFVFNRSRWRERADVIAATERNSS